MIVVQLWFSIKIDKLKIIINYKMDKVILFANFANLWCCYFCYVKIRNELDFQTELRKDFEWKAINRDFEFEKRMIKLINSKDKNS